MTVADHWEEETDFLSYPFAGNIFLTSAIIPIVFFQVANTLLLSILPRR